jgi:futalosine hydrolase
MKRIRKIESKPKILILGAFPPELKPLAKTLKSTPNVQFEVVGIGMVSAAINTTALITEHRPKQVLFVGSVGAASTKVPLLSVVSASSASLLDVGAMRGDSELLPMGSETVVSNRVWLNQICRANPEILRGGVYSATGLTRSKSLARSIAANSLTQFESMELYSVVAACRAAGVPWNSVQVVTNHLGPRGHLEWKRNNKKAALITAEVLAGYFYTL